MARGSEIFRGMIDAARNEVINKHKTARLFNHNGIVGDERAAAIAEFLRARLPDVFEIAKGEAVDCFDKRSGQLDFFIYDRMATKPISQQRENALVPCESLYSVIEVKSTFSRAEARNCLKAAAKVRRLRPFKHRFVNSRVKGAAVKDDEHRCMYVVFAYSSDLSESNWIKKEYERLCTVAAEEKIDPSVIDRVFVVDRGILNPVRSQGKLVEQEPEYLFAEFFLHLVNFIERERSRRPDISWGDYALPKSRGWKTVRLTKA